MERRSKRIPRTVLRWVKTNLKAFLALTGVVAGVVVGFVFRESLPSEERLQLLLALPGDILLRMLRILTLPFVVSSVFAASSEVKATTVATMAGRLLAFHVVSALVAAMMGVAAAAIVHPGRQDTLLTSGFYIEDKSYWVHILLDYFRNVVPENLVRSGFQHVRTIPYRRSEAMVSNDTYDQSPVELEVVETFHFLWKSEYRSGLSLFGVVLIWMSLGAASQPHSSVNRLVSVLYKVTMKMCHLVLWYFPLGVAFLIMADVLMSRDSVMAASQVALLVIAAGVASAVHTCLLLPLAYWLLTGGNPLTLFRHLFHALVVAFGSSSSLVSVPVAVSYMDQYEEGRDRSKNNILFPLGAAICMDGAAIYGAVVAIFLLQMNGINLTLGHYLYVGLGAFVLSFPSQTLPLFGIIYLVEQLTNYVELNQWLLILSVDWIISRFRSLVNLWSLTIGVTTVSHFSVTEADSSAKSQVQKEVYDDCAPSCSTTV